jgi:hypothetical protein
MVELFRCPIYFFRRFDNRLVNHPISAFQFLEKTAVTAGMAGDTAYLFYRK